MEKVKWVTVCESCGGNGCVEGEDELLWTCEDCGGSGEARAEWGLATTFAKPAVK